MTMRLTHSSILSILLLAGCAARIVRHPVPDDLRDHAHIPGVRPGIRAWGDSFSPAFQQSVADSFRQVRAAYRDRQPRDILAISGGGADGAFGAGLLCGWTAAGNRPVFRLVTGVSAGAIIATFAFLGPEYDGKLKELATTVSTREVFRWKALTVALGSDSLTSTAPLVRLIERYYDQPLLDAVAAEHAKGRRLYVATTDLDAQRPVIWDMGAIASSGSPQTLALFRQVILASGAIPAYFPPVYLHVQARGQPYDEMHVDGGTVQEVILYGEAVSPQALAPELHPPTTPPPKVYIIRNAKVAPEAQSVEPRLLPIAGRSIATLTKYQALGDLYRIYTITQRDGFDFNLAYIPDDFQDPATDTIQGFDPQLMTALFNRGYSLSKSKLHWHKTPPGLTQPTLERPAPKPN
jgi:predicted patatin/cPLA2 family phospholipase